jgi:hypothetical protein
MPEVRVLFKHLPRAGWAKLARQKRRLRPMASRLVGIGVAPYPLLYQGITVKICSPLLDIGAALEVQGEGAWRFFCLRFLSAVQA